jgi:hypothetical protein
MLTLGDRCVTSVPWICLLPFAFLSSRIVGAAPFSNVGGAGVPCPGERSGAVCGLRAAETANCNVQALETSVSSQAFQFGCFTVYAPPNAALPRRCSHAAARRLCPSPDRLPGGLKADTRAKQAMTCMLACFMNAKMDYALDNWRLQLVDRFTRRHSSSPEIEIKASVSPSFQIRRPTTSTCSLRR